MDKNRKIVFAETLYDGRGKKEGQSIVIEGQRIVEVSDKRLEADYSGFVTPGFIDAHTHIGMIRQGEPQEQREVNDHIQQINPLSNPLNSVYFDDRGLAEAVDFGVLYTCVVPGSGNLFGGKAMVIKTFAKNREEGFLKDYGYKMALGFNPKSTTEWKGARPNTRMGVYAMLEDKFDSVLLKEEKAKLEREKKLLELQEKQAEGKPQEAERKEALIQREYELAFSPEEQALLEILHGEKIAKVHVHKEDDVLYLIYLKKKYNLKVTADHTCDVSHREIYDKLAENQIQAVYGPLGSLDYKVELKNASYRNAKAIMESKVFFGLMSDHPVILTTNLRDSLKYFLIQGMSDEQAISLITYRNAAILGLEQELGVIEPGKLASLVVWDKHPLYLGAFPRAVIAEGRILRQRG